MANNNLKISVVATLEKELSKTEINKRISEIEGQFGKINLQIKIDDTVLKKLNDLTVKLKEFGKVSTESGKLVQEATQKDAKSVADLTQKYSKLISEVKKYKADGSLKGTTSTFQDDKGNGRVINTNAKGEVTSYKDIENIQKFQKEQVKLRKSLVELARTGTRTTEELRKIGQGINMASSIKQLDQLKNRMSNMKTGNNLVVEQEKLTQALKKTYDQGVITEQRFKRFNSMINSAKNVSEIEKIQKALNRVNETGKNKNLQQNMLSQAQSLLGSGSKKLDTAGVQNLITQLKGIQPNAQNATRELNKLQAQLKNYQKGARDATVQTKTFGDMMGQAFTKFPIWMLATSAFYAPITALKELVNTLYLLDERLISIKKVLDTADMTTIFENATKAAYEYGRTIDGALQSLGEISKLGFEQADAEALNKNSMLLSTVGEFRDDAEAANYLVAIMRQYKFTVAETTDVVNSLNEVSNKTGANTLGLAQALSKSSSTAAMAGVSFNDLNGMVSSTIETLKIGGNEAGNFYKTLFTRFLRGKTQSAIVDAGVQVKDLNGDLRSATDVLADLGEKWSSYGSDQKNALAQALGGVYHINKVSSLLENQEQVFKNAEFSANSYGSAQKELATFQEGLAFKTNNMKAAFQELAMTIGQNGARSGLVALIEGTTSLTQGFTALTEATDGWNIKLPLIAAGVYGVVKAFTALRLAMTGVKASFGVIGLGVIALETLASVFMKTTGAGTLHSEALTETAKKTSETSTEIQRLVGMYNELEPASKGSAEKQKELQGVLSEIQRLAPHLIDSTGKYGNELSLNKSKTDQYIDSLKKMTDEQVNQAKIANSIEISTVNVDLEGAKKKLKDLESSTKSTFDTMQSYQEKYNVNAIDDAEKEVAKRKKDLADEIIKQQNAGNSDTVTKLTENLNKIQNEFNAYKNLMETQSGAIQEYGNQLDKVNQLEGKKSGIEDRQKALDSLTGSTKNNTASNLKQSESLSKVGDGTYEASDGMDGMGDSAVDTGDDVEGLSASLLDASMSTKEIIRSSIESANALESEKGAVESNTASKYKNMSATEMAVGMKQDDINKTSEMIQIYRMLSGQENLSESSKYALATATQFLTSTYPHLINGHELNIDAMADEAESNNILIKAVEASANGQLTAQQAATTGTAIATKSRIEAIKSEIKGLQILLSAYGELAEASTDAIMAKVNAGLLTPDVALKVVGIKAGIEQRKQELAGLTKDLNGITIGLAKIPAISGTKSSSGKDSSKKDDKPTAEEVRQGKIDSTIKKYEDQLKTQDQLLQQSKAIQERYKEGSKEWIAESNKQIAILEKKRSITTNEINALKKLLTTEKLSTAQKAEVNAQILELTTSNLEYLNSIAEVNHAIQESKINAKIEETEALYNKEIAALQKKLDLMDEEEKAQDRINRKKELQAAIDQAKSDKRFEYIDKNGNVQLTYDKGKVAELEKEKADQEAEWKKEDARAALEQKIAEAEVNRDKAIANLEKLQETYLNKSYKDTADLKKIMTQFTKDLDTTFKSGTVSINKHHDGGIVGQGSKSGSRLPSLVNDLFNVKPNEEIVKALKGEIMIPQANIPNFLTNISNLAGQLLSNQPTQAVAQGTTIILQNPVIQANNPLELLQGLQSITRKK